jgi:hypothetical protein
MFTISLESSPQVTKLRAVFNIPTNDGLSSIRTALWFLASWSIRRVSLTSIGALTVPRILTAQTHLGFLASVTYFTQSTGVMRL